MTTEGLLVYLYDFWRAWPRFPVQAVWARRAELVSPWYRGKLVPTGSPGVSGRREKTPEPWETELYRRSVLFVQQCCFS